MLVESLVQIVEHVSRMPVDELAGIELIKDCAEELVELICVELNAVLMRRLRGIHREQLALLGRERDWLHGRRLHGCRLTSRGRLHEGRVKERCGKRRKAAGKMPLTAFFLRFFSLLA